MGKYYCKKCGMKFEIGEGIDTTELFDDGMCCPFNLSHGEMELIPDYETPSEYEKRTGKSYSDNGLVWVRFRDRNNFNYKQEPVKYFWLEYRWFQTKCWRPNNLIVIADPPVPPPDDWNPEEE